MFRRSDQPRSPGSDPLRVLLTSGLLLALTIPACTGGHYRDGRRALDDKRLADAVVHFEAALAADSTRFEARRDLGAARLLGGDPQGALFELEIAERLNADDARLYWLYASAYELLERPEEQREALATYERLSTRESTRSIVRHKIAQLDYEIARRQAAELRAARERGIQPDSASVAVYAFATPVETPSPRAERVCRALYTWVTTDLAKVERLHVIRADALDAIYAEQGRTFADRQHVAAEELTIANDIQPARHMVQGTFGDGTDEFISMGATCFDALGPGRLGGECGLRDGRMPDIFDVETQLVLDILDGIGVEPTQEERLAIGEKPTRDLDAFLAYADGLYLREQGDHEGAVIAFQQAADLDPGFVQAKQAAATSEVMLAPDQTIVVPAPPPTPLPTGHIDSSSGMLGLGLVPDSDAGDATGGSTEGTVVISGSVSVRVTAEIGDRR